MPRTLSLRLKENQIERLGRLARRLGRSDSDAAVLLLEESLRQEDFPFVEFRDSPVGRQAYLKGTRLATWQVAWLARAYDGDLSRIAADLEIPTNALAGALSYAAAYPAETDAAIADNAQAAEDLAHLIPNLEVVRTEAAAP
jgi:uncharacterized protein (DUF433 family)